MYIYIYTFLLLLFELVSDARRLLFASIAAFHQNVFRGRIVREDVHSKNVIKCWKMKVELKGEGVLTILLNESLKESSGSNNGTGNSQRIMNNVNSFIGSLLFFPYLCNYST